MAAVKGYIELRTCLIEISTLRTSQTNEVQDSVMTINVLNHLNWCVTDQAAICNPNGGVEVGKKRKRVS